MMTVYFKQKTIQRTRRCGHTSVLINESQAWAEDFSCSPTSRTRSHSRRVCLRVVVASARWITTGTTKRTWETDAEEWDRVKELLAGEPWFTRGSRITIVFSLPPRSVQRPRGRGDDAHCGPGEPQRANRVGTRRRRVWSVITRAPRTAHVATADAARAKPRV